MEDHYFFLSSVSTLSHKTNHFFDFTVEFPQTINLSSELWQLGLSQISFSKRESSISPNMYVCCDIISPSFCDNNTSQILRFIPIQKGKTNINFGNIFYHDVVPNYIIKIRIYIRPLDEIKKSFKVETLYCTLHLRQKNNNEVCSENRG